MYSLIRANLGHKTETQKKIVKCNGGNHIPIYLHRQKIIVLENLKWVDKSRTVKNFQILPPPLQFNLGPKPNMDT